MKYDVFSSHFMNMTPESEIGRGGGAQNVITFQKGQKWQLIVSYIADFSKLDQKKVTLF